MLACALAMLLAQSGARPPVEDFDLLPKEAIPDAAAVARQKEVERKLDERRKLLRLHQLGGVTMLATLGTTVVLGELDYLDKYGGRGDTGKWHQWHRWTAFSAATLFAGTAALALLAPVPVEKPVRLDTATLHKIFMSVAAAGMVAQIVLGVWTANKEGQVSQRDFALAHQVIGFATFAAAGAGFTVWVF